MKRLKILMDYESNEPRRRRGEFALSGRRESKGQMRNIFLIILILWLGCGGVVALAQEKPQAPEGNIAELKGEVNKERLEKWLMLPPQQRKQLIEKYKILMSLSPEERMKLRENLERFKSLSPQQKEVLRRNWQKIKDLSDAQRQAIRNNYKRWQKLSPQERQALRQKYRRFLQLSPERRSRIMEQYKKWKGLPEGERQKVLQRQRWKRQMMRRNPKAI